MAPVRRTIGMNEFKAKCLRLMDEVAKSAEVIVSKRGKPFAKVVRLEVAPRQKVHGILKGKIEFQSDIVNPDWSNVFELEGE